VQPTPTLQDVPLFTHLQKYHYAANAYTPRRAPFYPFTEVPLCSQLLHSKTCPFVPIYRCASLQPSACARLFCRVRRISRRVLGTAVFQPLALHPGRVLRRQSGRGAPGADGGAVQHHVSGQAPSPLVPDALVHCRFLLCDIHE
jgi:hypothetical protein